jgi:hypothetical protein
VDKTQAFKNAASQLRTWSAVCLLGAGASYANGLPTLSQIPDLLWFAFDSSLEARKLLAKKLGEKDKAAKALIGKNKDKIVAAWEVLKQNAKVRLAFQKGFAELDLKRRSQYSPLYTGLAQLIHRRVIDYTISFNWDSLLESAYQKNYGAELAGEWLHKPHGDVAHPEADWILPHEAGRIDDAIVSKLLAMAKQNPRTLLVIGYSERDEEIVRRIVKPLEARWSVIRIGPTAKGDGSVSCGAEEAIDGILKSLNLPAEAPGWEYVSFVEQRGIEVAFAGERLGAADVDSCPRLQEVEALLKVFETTPCATLVGESGAGKSLTAFQVAATFCKKGYEVLRLCDSNLQSKELLLASLSVLPRKTLLLLDDADRVSPGLIETLRGTSSSQRPLLVVLSDKDNKVPSVMLDAKAAVNTISQFLLVDRPKTLELVKKADPYIGEGYISTALETRLDEANEAESPWRFMFILTAGWRRYRNTLAHLKSLDRLDILFGMIAARQTVTLDGLVSSSWLTEVARHYDKDDDWIKEGLRQLRERRLILGDSQGVRCSHRRLASVALELLCETASDAELTKLIPLLRSVFLFETPPLRGISWLAHALIMTGPAFGKMKKKDLISDATLRHILNRCLASVPGVSRRDAFFAMTNLRDWNPTIFDRLWQEQPRLSAWITEPDPESAAACGSFLNQIAQRDKKLVVKIIRRSDPVLIADKVSSSLAGQSYFWAELVKNLYYGGPRWRSRFAKALDRSRLKALFLKSKLVHLEGMAELAESLFYYSQPLALKLTRTFTPQLAAALNRDPAKNAARIQMSLLWHVLGFNLLDNKSKPNRAQRLVSKNLVARLNPKRIAAALPKYPRRDWEPYCRCLLVIRGTSEKKHREIVKALNWAKLEAATNQCWATFPRDLRLLLGMLITTKNQEPSRSWVARHADDIQQVVPFLIWIAPQAMAKKIKSGSRLDLSVQAGHDWGEAMVALMALAKIDKEIVQSVLKDNLQSLAQGFSNLSNLHSELVPLTCKYLKSLRPKIFHEMAPLIDHALALKAWDARAKGQLKERRAVRAVLQAFPNLPADLQKLRKKIKRKR